MIPQEVDFEYGRNPHHRRHEHFRTGPPVGAPEFRNYLGACAGGVRQRRKDAAMDAGGSYHFRRLHLEQYSLSQDQAKQREVLTVLGQIEFGIYS